jgi:hypothetical protein
MTPGWHITRNLNLLCLKMGIWTNANVNSNKCVTIMSLKPNQPLVTTINPLANAIIERVHKVVNDMLRSFDMENDNENLQKDNPIEYLIQSIAWAIRSTYHTTLQATPYQFVFVRDLIYNFPF